MITRKISFMYRMAIPEPMKKAYFDVVDECTALGEEKIAYVFYNNFNHKIYSFIFSFYIFINIYYYYYYL